METRGKAESSLMFSLEFEWNMVSLMLIVVQPGMTGR
jgi:hypothetical protein